MKITRKTFVKGLALGTISLPVFLRGCMDENFAQQETVSGRMSDKKYEWKMVTTWPPNYPILGESCQMFADLVEIMSGGRIEIQVYGGGELVPALETFDTVRNGGAEIGSGASYYWAGKIPAAQFFATVPFGLNAQQMTTWITSGGGMELWQELYGQYNLVPMMAGITGVQMGGWFNKEINTIDDLKGLKMRIPGLGGKVLEKAGGSPVLLAGGELYTGLERGIIDATEWLGPYHDFAMGFHEIAKYYYAPGWHEPGTALEFIINKEKYEALPEDLQAIIKAAGWQAHVWMCTEMEARNGEFLEKLKASDVDIRFFPKEVLDQLRVYNKEVIDELVDSDDFAKRVYDSYSAFSKKAAAWSELSEKAYYNSLQATDK
jgi:TRAP-type mannitol/chloroaromatic compound transport system substrate-binding protein